MTKDELIAQLQADLDAECAKQKAMTRGYPPHREPEWRVLKGRISALRKAINLMARLPGDVAER